MDTLNQPQSPQPPVEQTPVSAPKPSLHPKALLITFALFILLFFTLTILLLASRTKPASQPPLSISPPLSQPSPTPVDETANWKTYKNEKRGYMVRIPPEWIHKEFSGNKDLETRDYDDLDVAFAQKDKNQQYNILEVVGEREDPKVFEFGCNVVGIATSISSKLSLEETVLLYYNLTLKGSEKKNVQIGENKGLQFNKSALPLHEGYRHPELVGATTFMKYNNSTVVIVGHSCAGNEQKFFQKYNQILSTFQFLN